MENSSRADADGSRKQPSTKQHLIETGMGLLLKHGYYGLGLQALLEKAGIPKGSFYHHFRDKEDYALQVLDTYMDAVHASLDASLGDASRPPLERIRTFFEATRASYEREQYLGCLIGGLGQELSGVSDVFRQKIDACFSALARRLAGTLEEARLAGQIREECDTRALADLLVDCWEGAALRSRLRRNPDSLVAMVDFYLRAVTGP